MAGLKKKKKIILLNSAFGKGKSSLAHLEQTRKGGRGGKKSSFASARLGVSHPPAVGLCSWQAALPGRDLPSKPPRKGGLIRSLIF